VTNYNLLYFNLLKKPFNDPAFRQAVAYAIDTASAADKAYGPTVKAGSPSLIIPSQVDQWLDPANKANFYSYDAAKAKSILEGAGYKWGSSGELILPSGEAMPAMNILVGSGWTDFITIAQVITENLKQIGITANIDQEAWNTYISSLMSGTYDTAICWGMTSGSTPFPMLYYTFGGSFYAPEGKTANSNYARYKNDTVDKALADFAGTTDPAVQKQAINTAVGQLLKDLPVVVLTERTNFSCYTTWNFTGWPSTDDPYNDGAALDTPGSGEMVLLNVHQN
jgi:peptide/nickel transport system substrate-binding protein